MSDLQWSLLVIGAAVVGGVCLYNWLQERRFYRRVRQAFGVAQDDVLLEAGIESALADGRLEPQLAPPEAGLDAQAAPERTRVDREVAASADPSLHYVAEIDSDAPIAEAIIAELANKIASCGKPVHIAGLGAGSEIWDDAIRGKGGRFRRLRVSLQLVNRSGPVNSAQLAAFCDAVRNCADKVPAPAACPDSHAALKSARELDAFCADVDVAVGINIVAAEGEKFAGARIRAAAEAAGFKLEPDGVFHYRGGQRETLFTLDNHEPAPFLPESIKGLSTHGVTVLLDVPRVANGAEVLDRMLEVAHGLAAALGGRLVDDNRVALSAPGLARIKEQVRSIHARMDLRGIPAGSPRALRLFS